MLVILVLTFKKDLLLLLLLLDDHRLEVLGGHLARATKPDRAYCMMMMMMVMMMVIMRMMVMIKMAIHLYPEKAVYPVRAFLVSTKLPRTSCSQTRSS